MGAHGWLRRASAAAAASPAFRPGPGRCPWPPRPYDRAPTGRKRHDHVSIHGDHDARRFRLRHPRAVRERRRGPLRAERDASTLARPAFRRQRRRRQVPSTSSNMRPSRHRAPIPSGSSRRLRADPPRAGEARYLCADPGRLRLAGLWRLGRRLQHQQPHTCLGREALSHPCRDKPSAWRSAMSRTTASSPVPTGWGGTFVNVGTLNAGPSLNADVLVNTGNLRIGALEAFGISRVSGAFDQRSTGRLLIDADFVNRRSDILLVEGRADLAGRIRPLISTVLPNIEVPFLVVNGAIAAASTASHRPSSATASAARATPSPSRPPPPTSRRPATASPATPPPSLRTCRRPGMPAAHRPWGGSSPRSATSPMPAASSPIAPPCGRSRPTATSRPARAWPPGRRPSSMRP
jgi:hypothetical protein